MLVEAAIKGEWVLLENANMCEASILDRIMSLLEEDCGEIVLNECGVEEAASGSDGGQIRKVRAHPKFRVFFTVNSETQGMKDISRPLRNRCVELFIGRDNAREETEKVAAIVRRIGSIAEKHVQEGRRMFGGNYSSSMQSLRAIEAVSKLFNDIEEAREFLDNETEAEVCPMECHLE